MKLFFSLKILMTIILLLPLVIHSGTPTCSPYTEKKYKRGIRAFNKMFEDPNNNPIFHNNFNISSSSNLLNCFTNPSSFDTSHMKEFNINKGQECMSNQSSRLNTNTACRWFYQLNIDTERKPKEIMQAKCCDSTSTSFTTCNGTCVPVSIYYPVLRRKKNKFLPSLETVNVGCVCSIRE